MRIALVHPYSWPAVRRGGERYLHDLAWAIGQAGHEAHVVTGGPRRETRDGAITVHAIGGARWLQRARVSEVDAFGAAAAVWLQRNRFDVVHALVPTAALAGRASRHPTVYTALGHPTPAWAEANRGQARLLRLVVRTANQSTVLSTSAAAAFRDVTGTDAVIVPPGVRTDVFTPREGAAAGPPRVLFASAPYQRNKRLDVLVRAFDAVLDAHPDARLQLGAAGDASWAFPDDEVGRRVRRATDLLGDGVLDEVPARYRSATVTVLPSEFEAFGLVLAEALACGVPVVGTTSGGGADIVTDDRVGRLVAPRDVPALAAALLETIDLARRPDTAAACATHARTWDWASAIGPAHLDVYERLLA